jgi:hypothetical protein
LESFPLTAFAGFNKVFARNPKHSKAFTIHFAQVLMMDFMRFAQSTQVGAICFLQYRKSLVDKKVMHKEVAEAI